MTIKRLETHWTFGDFPEHPEDDLPALVAFEAGSSEDEAYRLINAAWQQAEIHTGKTFRDVTTGKVLVHVVGAELFKWPRYPFPSAVTAQGLCNGTWLDTGATYAPDLGWIELETHMTYRLTQIGTVPGETPSENVFQAVRQLATYQLIQSPSRREFKSQSAGDTSWSREQVMGVMYGSGAGALLAGEVRL